MYPGLWLDIYDFPLSYGIIFVLAAPIAQLDRASDYESVGRGFESLWAHQLLSPPNGKHPDYKDFLDIDIAELVHYTEIYI